MPDREFLPSVEMHKKVLFAARAILWTILIGLTLVTLTGFGVVISQINHNNDRLIDCIVPTGGCYIAKVRGVNQNSIIDVNVAVEWCGNHERYQTIGELRTCVYEQLRIIR